MTSWWMMSAVTVVLMGDRSALQAKEALTAPTVQDGMDVAMEYTLTVDGAVVDSTEGKASFHYVHGKGQIIPGLEQQLAGLRVGDTKDVVVAPEDGYGQIDSTAFVEVPKAQLPADLTPAVGMALRGMNPDGQAFRARVEDVKEDTVVLDLNHELAGKTLNFTVKITDITAARTQ